LSGSLAGKDPQSSSTAGGIGGLLGYAAFGPVGGIVGGLVGGLFGGKKSTPAPDPANRELYGMPDFEYESYLYNLFERKYDLLVPKGSNTDTRLVNISSMEDMPTDLWGRVKAGINTLKGEAVGWGGAGVSQGMLVININGGDINQVQKTVDDALEEYFSSVAAIQTAKASAY